MTTEAKVGAFTLIGLALLAYMIVHLSGFSFSGSKGYNINVLFSQANGLRPGAVVRYAGVEIGTVKNVMAEEQGAKVVLSIDPGTKITKKAQFVISSDGLMGEKFIDILPSSDSPEEFLEPGAVVSGASGRASTSAKVPVLAALMVTVCTERMPLSPFASGKKGP